MNSYNKSLCDHINIASKFYLGGLINNTIYIFYHFSGFRCKN